ncbi:glycosyltransferase family A protein [Thalassomonas sp. M1454]|uniref:glycosyltransferase family A protein n=1 Tax=Thalassomonas sp. M1454 TaxID=2594477 RepID=UPI00117D506D|nr:glycosyltransferase family A protein [Thalassomonas sp. M1454]TRX58155.1 glycosyltransferase family 2 protein [Thalassomonas sp. M1454]
MYFCVFSYNRGQLLKNCIESILRCTDNATIFIFDDNSDDPLTLEVLASLSSQTTIIKPNPSDVEQYKCGGLHNNMQMALDYIPAGELAYFVQDDTQLVRKIDIEDIYSIHDYFNKKPNSAFLQYAFIKGKNRQRALSSTVYDQESNSYYRKNTQQSAGVYYSDICIANVDRLKAANWNFISSEKDNSKQALENFEAMGFMVNPFLMYLPSAPAYRGKMKTFGHKLAEKKNLCGFHPLKYMTDDEIQKLKQRDVKQLPFAEDFLHLKEGDLPTPWIMNPFQGTKICKPLHKLELTIRNWFN